MMGTLLIQDVEMSIYSERKQYDSLVTGMMKGLTAGLIIGFIGGILSAFAVRSGKLEIPFLSFPQELSTVSFFVVWCTICISLSMLVLGGLAVLFIRQRKS